MTITDKNKPIYKMSDGGWNVSHEHYRYVVRSSDPLGLYKTKDIETYLKEHPDALIPEPTPPEPTAEEKASVARRHRGALLAACDWTQVADAPVDQAAWKMYRQALRDWPKSNGFPNILTIPKEPIK